MRLSLIDVPSSYRLSSNKLRMSLPRTPDCLRSVMSSSSMASSFLPARTKRAHGDRPKNSFWLKGTRMNSGFHASTQRATAARYWATRSESCTPKTARTITSADMARASFKMRTVAPTLQPDE